MRFIQSLKCRTTLFFSALNIFYFNFFRFEWFFFQFFIIFFFISKNPQNKFCRWKLNEQRKKANKAVKVFYLNLSADFNIYRLDWSSRETLQATAYTIIFDRRSLGVFSLRYLCRQNSQEWNNQRLRVCFLTHKRILVVLGILFWV